MTPAADCDLQTVLRGCGVLVTRPAHQAEPMCRILEAAGARAVRFPVLAILPAQDRQKVQAQIARLTDYDTAIFISANAVEQTCALLPPTDWPTQVKIAAIGSATTRKLMAQGLIVTSSPTAGFTSEALLALPGFQDLQGRRILILRGENGREHLRDNLLQRGAQVDYLDVYRRVRADSDPPPLLKQWQNGEVNAVLLTSAESLHQLCAILGTLGEQLLRTTTLVVANERIRTLAQSLGLTGTVVIATDATDEAMLDALRQHYFLQCAQQRTES